MQPITLTQWMEASFRQNARRPALTFMRGGKVETRLTYSELHRETLIFSNALAGGGITRGDRVILLLQKSVHAVITHLALQWIGAVAVHLNPGFKRHEMQYLLSDAEARMVLCETGRADWIKAIDASAKVSELPTHLPYTVKAAPGVSSLTEKIAEPSPRDTGLMIYTSGTTGHPKGVLLTHQNLTHDAGNIITIWNITSDDVLCHALPLFHVHGLCFALHTALLSGAHVLLLDRFDPATVVEVWSIKTGDAVCTLFMAVPAMYAAMLDQLAALGTRTDFSHVRLFTSGSAPLLPREFKRIAAGLGQEPVEREGMSETGMNFSNPIYGRRKPGSIGIPLPGLKVRIVDPKSGQDIETGRVGEIWLKSPSITPGYWRKPRETQTAFIDGWFRTGDLGQRDTDGYYFLTDRIKHIITTGGENVSAKEVELVINRIEGVAESAVVGVPDAKWGERVVPAVIAQKGADLSPEAIIDYCRAHLHDWKCPKEIRFFKALPRNTMGKVVKEEVRQRFQ